jgi:hypothetical protein
MPYRVVRSPGATAHPFRQVPVSQQTESAARAAMANATVRQGIGTFDLGGGGYSPPGGPGGLASVGDLLGMLGIPAPPRAGGFDESGMPTPGDYYNPITGTLGGALLSTSGGGRRIADLIGALHAGPGAGGSNPFRPGGQFSARGMPGQWVSQEGSEPQSGSGRAPQFHGESPATDEQAEKNRRAIGRDALVVGAGILLNRYLFPAGFIWGAYFFPKSSATTTGGTTTKYPTGPGGPVSPSPYYPTVGPQPGHLSPHEAASALRQLQQERKWGSNAPWRNNQWLTSRTASGSGSGGGGDTSRAPEKLLLRGMRYPEEWVAIRPT